ncbi:major facilitator superfamily domain-containing protein [Geranomyces variabilis]|nr:major facilitator superfamily domain-containing protein [Geranomyces variabilis]
MSRAGSSESTPLLAAEHAGGDRRPSVSSADVVASPRSRPSPYHVGFPLFMSVFSYSLASVPTQQFLLVYLCRTLFSDSPVGNLFLDGSTNTLGPDFATCRNIPEVQALTAKWTMAISLAISLPAVLATPLIGHLADRFGRRPFFMLPCISGTVAILAVLGVAAFDLPLWVLLVANLVQGLLGGYQAILMITWSYLADVTPAHSRARVFLITEAFVFVAFTGGPYVGGLLTRILPSGVVGVFQFSLIGKLLALLYVVLLLPESLEKAKIPSVPSVAEGPAAAGSTTPFYKAALWTRLSTPSTLLRMLAQPPRSHLVFIAFVTALGVGGLTLFFYYCSYRLGWDSLDEGIYLLYLSVTRLIWMLGVGGLIDRHASKPTLPNPALASAGATAIPPLILDVRRKVRSEVMTVRLGMVISAIGMITIGFLSEGWMVYVVATFTGFGTLAKPTIRALLSRSTPPTLQGRMFSILQITDQVASVMSSFIFPPIWAATVGTRFPGTFLFVIGVFFFAGAGVAFAGLSVDDLIDGFHAAPPTEASESSDVESEGASETVNA